MTRHLILAQLKKEIDLILSFQKRVTKPARKTRLLILLMLVTYERSKLCFVYEAELARKILLTLRALPINNLSSRTPRRGMASPSDFMQSSEFVDFSQ